MTEYKVKVVYTATAETVINADHFETAEDIALEMSPSEFQHNIKYLDGTLEVLEVEELEAEEVY